MKKINLASTDVSNLCAQTGEEDGIDPRYLKKYQEDKKDHQKSSRICNEVTKVISLVLAGDMGNPVLQNLQVQNVSAESDGQFLNISVAHYATDLEMDSCCVIFELKRVQGYLRSAISQRINRKRVPALKFTYACIKQ